MKEIWLRIRSSERAFGILSVGSRIAVLLFVFAAAGIAVSAFLEGWMRGLLVCALAFGSFGVVTLARARLDFPRPYEDFDFLTEDEKSALKTGKSFPSRHTFSAFLIAGLALSIPLPLAFSVLFACVLFALACFLATARVLLGYHYPRDVIAGALLGVLSAGLADLFLRL